MDRQEYGRIFGGGLGALIGAGAAVNTDAAADVTFYRDDPNTGLTVARGPYAVTVAWANRQAQATGGETDSIARLVDGVLAGPLEMDVLAGDYMGAVQGRKGGMVTEVHPPAGGRRMVSFTVPAGVAP